MNPNQSNPENAGNPATPPVEMTPVETQPLQMPTEEQPRVADNPVEAVQDTSPEQTQVVPPITEKVSSIDQPIPNEAERVHQVTQILKKNIESLDDARRLSDGVSFED